MAAAAKDDKTKDCVITYTVGGDTDTVTIHNVSKDFVVGAVIAGIMVSGNSGEIIKIEYDGETTTRDEFYYPYLVPLDPSDAPATNHGLKSLDAGEHKGWYFCYSGKNGCEAFHGETKDIVDGFRHVRRLLNPKELDHVKEGCSDVSGILTISVDGVEIDSQTVFDDWTLLQLPARPLQPLPPEIMALLAALPKQAN